MNLANIHDAKDRLFQVLQTTKLSQTAVMNLKPGGLSSDEMNVHKKSDQIALVLTGELLAEVGDEKKTLRARRHLRRPRRHPPPLYQHRPGNLALLQRLFPTRVPRQPHLQRRRLMQL